MSNISHLDPQRHSLAGQFAASLWRPSLLRANAWLWPLLAAPLLAALGYYVYSSVQHSLRQAVREQLVAMRDAELEALQIWMGIQRSTAASLATDPHVSSLAEQLIALHTSGDLTNVALIESPLTAQLADEIAANTRQQSYAGFVLLDADFTIVASELAELVGKPEAVDDAVYAATLAAGNPIVTRPIASKVLREDVDGELRAGVPTMFAAAPLLDAEGEFLGAICLRIRPDVDFTRILSVGNFGDSGETFAFDEQGVVLSRTRFEDQLKHIGLLQDKPYVTSVLNLEVRDPGVDLTRTTARPSQTRGELPLTKMAASAVTGESGVDVDGYRDFRGVPVVGAWTWLPEYGFGVATELDSAEAFRAANFIGWVHRAIGAVLALLTGAMFAATWVMAKAERQARDVSLAAKQIGQYHLEKALGQGGMGVVYAARHALLRRPTAVKMLLPGRSNEESIARFEREVQLTSRLNHPNTITIYDYGRTEDGIFYYAMELLEGIDLEQLVQRYGAQPPGRVANILIQACGSLNEAHAHGLIHRDIKPGNIMLTQRGGISDFVKVLDFGLVKAVDTAKEQALTADNVLTGTPLFMPPEAIELPDSVDARSDIYALAAVGYFLLTGTPVFSGKSLVDICMQQVTATPISPSKRLGKAVPTLLEEALLAGLEKQPLARPQTAKEFAQRLEAAARETPWMVADADRWWAGYTSLDQQQTRDSTTKNILAETQISAQPQ
jgi:hypothetical protein